MKKPDAVDFAAERYELSQLKKGVPHPKAEQMEKRFMAKARRGNITGEDKAVRRAPRGGVR